MVRLRDLRHCRVRSARCRRHRAAVPRIVAAILLAAASLLPKQGEAADAAAGQAVFNRCRICHAIEAGKPSTVGPNLHGLFGRKAGTAEHFAYSDAMKNSAIVWDDKTMGEYLRNPRDFIPGNKMAFPGIKSDEEIADLLAYLHQASQ